jgi:hypothetical protein
VPFPPLDPTKFPPAAKRDFLPIVLIFTALMLAMILWLARSWVQGTYSYWFFAAPILSFVITMSLVMSRNVKLARRIDQSIGRLCVYCKYDVSALPPKGHCPECGGPYDHKLNRAMWSNLQDIPPLPVSKQQPGPNS